MTYSGSLIGIAVHMSAYVDLDWWSLSGSSWQLCDMVYTKSVPESIIFEMGQDLVSGSSVIFEFYNSTGSAKTIWIDYYFIR